MLIPKNIFIISTIMCHILLIRCKLPLPYTILMFIIISFNTPLKMRLWAYNIYYVYFKYTHYDKATCFLHNDNRSQLTKYSFQSPYTFSVNRSMECPPPYINIIFLLYVYKKYTIANMYIKYSFYNQLLIRSLKISKCCYTPTNHNL